MTEPTIGAARVIACVIVSRHYFGDWSHLSWTGRITLTIKKLLVRIGIKGRVENHLLSAHKTQTGLQSFQAPNP